MIGIILLLVLAATAIVFTLLAVARDGYGARPTDMSSSTLVRSDRNTRAGIDRLG
jgi:hypothetical protein